MQCFDIFTIHNDVLAWTIRVQYIMYIKNYAIPITVIIIIIINPIPCGKTKSYILAIHTHYTERRH